MGRLLWFSRVKIRRLSTILILIQCLVASTAWAYYDKKRIHLEVFTSEDLSVAIKDYEAQLKALNELISGRQADMEWLVFKVNRIAESGRNMSEKLKSSVKKKEMQIQVLTKEKKRIEAVLARYKEAYAAKRRKERALQGMKPVATGVPEFGSAAQNTQSSFGKGKRDRIEIAVKKAGLDDWVEVVPTDDGCAKLENTLPILFSSGSATLAKEYRTFLKKLANFLKSYDVKVYVNGYADPDPIRTKRYPSNFELGASRAANVVHVLVKNGLKPSIFNIGSTGEYHFTAGSPTKKKPFKRRANLTVVFSG